MRVGAISRGGALVALVLVLLHLASERVMHCAQYTYVCICIYIYIEHFLVVKIINKD